MFPESRRIQLVFRVLCRVIVFDIACAWSPKQCATPGDEDV